MKRLFFTLFFVNAFVLGMFAQTPMGKGAIAGALDFGFSTETEKTGSHEVKSNSFEIAPSFGYLVIDNLMAGLEIGYKNSSYEVPGTSSTTTTTTSIFGVRPFLRYYNMVNEKAGFFGEFGVGFGSGKNEVEFKPTGSGTTITTKKDVSVLDLGLKFGAVYFISNRFAIEAKYGNIGYEAATYEPDGGGEKTEQSGFDINLKMSTLQFGLVLHLH